MEVSTANSREVGDFIALRDELARWLTARGIDQWQPGELLKDWIEQEVTQGFVHVVRDAGDLVATVTVTPQDPTVWGHQIESAGRVHRLMVDRRWAGRRIGAVLLTWAETHIRESGCTVARLDCVRSNRHLREYYELSGYRLVGYKNFPDIDWARETALYEKALV
jgi:GNAT superfamily N-acetyltransferase